MSLINLLKVFLDEYTLYTLQLLGNIGFEGLSLLFIIIIEK